MFDLFLHINREFAPRRVRFRSIVWVAALVDLYYTLGWHHTMHRHTFQQYFETHRIPRLVVQYCRYRHMAQSLLWNSAKHEYLTPEELLQLVRKYKKATLHRPVFFLNLQKRWHPVRATRPIRLAVKYLLKPRQNLCKSSVCHFCVFALALECDLTSTNFEFLSS